MPNATEAPELESEDEEEELEVTDEESESEDSNTEGTDDEDSEEDDPIEAFKQHYLQNDRKTLEETLREQIKAEVEQAATAARRTEESAQVREKFNSSFRDASKKTNDLLKGIKFYDEDGNSQQITEEFVQQIVNPWNEHHKTVLAGAENQVYADVAETVFNSLPMDVREEFAKRAANKPLKDYLTAFAELYAPTTSSVKKMQEEMEEKVRAAEARGYAKGVKAKGGTIPSTGDRAAVKKSAAPDTTTLVGATRAKNSGQITDREYDEIVRKLFNR